MVLVACFQYGNFFPILTIFINLMAIMQLMLCGACASDASGYTWDSPHQEAAVHVAWWIFGLFVILGYAIPALLYRASVVPTVALYLTWTGGTTILAAMIVYMRLIYRD